MSVFEIALGIIVLAVFLLLIYNAVIFWFFRRSRYSCIVVEEDGPMTKERFDRENKVLKSVSKTKLESKKEWINNQ